MTRARYLLCLIPLLAGACGDAGRTSTDAAPAGESPPPAQVRVVAEDFAYAPHRIEVASGEELSMQNRGYAFHDLKVEGEQGLLIPKVASGATTVARVDLQPGTYTIYCTVDDHRKQGMEATLVIR
jgi:plastocyanin